MSGLKSFGRKPGPTSWQNRDAKGGPPDLDALLKNWIKRLSNSYKPARGMLPNPRLNKLKYLIIVGILFLVWFLSGFFIVQPAERAIILQFGRYIGSFGPGPHWIPTFIEERLIVNEEKTQTYSYQADMLTKDETIVSVAVSVFYRIENARDYLFNTVSAEDSLQQATASALRQVIGHNTLDAIITYGRSAVRAQVEYQLRHILARYKTGIVITDVVLQPARAPDQVKEAFDDAIKAQEDEQRLINQAQAYAMKIFPLAEGNAKRIITDARAYKDKVVLLAEGEATRFDSLRKEYEKAPGVTRERLYIQAMEKLYSNTPKIIIDVKQSHPLIQLPLEKLIAGSGHTPREQHSESVADNSAPPPATTAQGGASGTLQQSNMEGFSLERTRPLTRERRE